MGASPPDPARRPRASVPRSILEGWRRVAGAPWIIGSVLCVTILLALPLTSPIGGDVGLDRAITNDMSPLFDGGLVTPQAVGGFALWVFVSGGILDRFARGRRVGTGPFFSACGVYGVRFLRLSIVTGAAYWALFRWLRPQLPATPSGRWIFLAALLGVGLIADIARVRTVVEDRRSVLSAIAASMRFIRRRLWRTLALYLVTAGLLGAIAVAAESWTVSPVTAAPWVVPSVAVMYLLVRLSARLACLASETVFFQGELAHAHYTAAPVPTWPDSAAVEAIKNLTRAAKN